MDIVVKGRKTDVAQRFRNHAAEKLSKVSKLDHKVIRIDVEVSKERNPRLSDLSDRVEITCRSRGPVIRAEAAATDPYAALDMAMDKLESRLRRAADRRRVHHGNRTPLSVSAATANAADLLPETPPEKRSAPPEQDRATTEAASSEAPPSGATSEAASAGVARSREAGGIGGQTVLGVQQEPEGDERVVPMDMDGDGPLVVREKVHRGVPMTLDQALFEMELVGHDFYLFVDQGSGRPSVVYRRRGYDYGVISLEA